MPGPSLALLGVVRFRQPGGGLVIGTYAFVVAVWLIVALRPGVDPAPWELGVQIGGTALFVVASVLQVLTRVRADVDGVRSSDQLGRRRRLDWSRIDHFEIRGTRPTLGAVTVDGRWVRLMTFGNYIRQATERVEELEAYRRRRLQAGGAG